MTANGIGVEEAKAVSEMLKTNKTLSELNLGGKKWGKDEHKGEKNNTKRQAIKSEMKVLN